jgi:hypothetical protein
MVQTIIADVRPVLDQLPPEARKEAVTVLVKAYVKHKRLAYMNGWAARRYRRMTGKAA